MFTPTSRRIAPPEVTLGCASWLDDQFFITAGDDDILYMEDLRENSHFKTEKFPIRCQATCLSTSRSIGNRHHPLAKSKGQVVIGTGDGSILILQVIEIKDAASFGISFKEEKRIEGAHKSCSVTCIAWSPAGSFFASAAEDGILKLWSKAGVLRTNLHKSQLPVYILAWVDGEGQRLCFSSGSEISVIGVNGNHGGLKSEAFQWTAHEGQVTALAADQNSGNILSGGLDNRCRIWDTFGRKLFQSAPLGSTIVDIDLCQRRSDDLIFVAHSRGIVVFNKKGSQICSWPANPGIGLERIHVAEHGVLFAYVGNDNVLWTSSIRPKDIVLEDFIFSVSQDESKLIRIEKLGHSPKDDSFETKGRIRELYVQKQRVFVVTFCSQLEIFNLEKGRLQQAFDLWSPAPRLLFNEDIFMCEESIYNIDGKKLVSSNQLTGPSSLFPGDKTFELVGLGSTFIAVAVNILTPQDTAISKQSEIKYMFFNDPRRIEVVELSFSVEQIYASPHEDMVLVIGSNGVPHAIWLNESSGPKIRTFPLANMKSLQFNATNTSVAFLSNGSSSILLIPNPKCAILSNEFIRDSIIEINIRDSLKKQITNLINFSGIFITLQLEGGSNMLVQTPHLIHDLLDVVRIGGLHSLNQATQICHLSDMRQLWFVLAAESIQRTDLQCSLDAFAALGNYSTLSLLQKISACSDDIKRRVLWSLVAGAKGSLNNAQNILLENRSPRTYEAVKLNILSLQFSLARKQTSAKADLHALVETYEEIWNSQEINSTSKENLMRLKHKLGKRRLVTDEYSLEKEQKQQEIGA